MGNPLDHPLIKLHGWFNAAFLNNNTRGIDLSMIGRNSNNKH